MNTNRRTLHFLVLTAIFLFLTAWTQATVDQYYALFKAVEPVPNLTQEFPDTDYNDAYAFQEALIDRFAADGDPVIGYKVGLTGPQLPFGAEEPIYGRLYDSMVVAPNNKIFRSDYIIPMVEIELAFIFGEDVTYPVTQAELAAKVVAVAPAVEFPDLLFEDLPNLFWLDIIAMNVSPRQVIIGQPIPIDQVDVNNIQVTVRQKNQIINQGVSTNVLGDQWESLLFLVERLDSRGYQIQAGDVVMTGAMSGMFPAAPGHYHVQYENLGKLRFKVVE
ncbi:MAG: fumarylacetoacetate hydrolase family protein [Chloroflexota bacterium]